MNNIFIVEYSFDYFIFLYLIMIFLHIIGDYLVQTDFLAKFKQKKNWVEDNEANNNKYLYDYIPILLVHSFSWSFISLLPILLFKNILLYCILIIINTIIHAYIDDLKCNKYKINLIADQSYHLIQLLVSLSLAMIIS